MKGKIRTSSAKILSRTLHITGLTESRYEPLGIFGQSAELTVAVWKFSPYGRGGLALLAVARDVQAVAAGI